MSCDPAMTNPQHEALVEAVARLKASWERVSCEMGNIQYPGMHADLEDAGSDLWDEFEKTSAALSATAATPSDEEVRLRAELRRIAEGNLGDAAWQANYDRIREVARAALEPQGKDL